MATVLHTVTLDVITCYKCAISFGMPHELNEEALKNGRDFYCPNGHSQIYGEPEVKRLQKQLAQKEFQCIAERNARMAVEKKLIAAQERTRKGFCPCCNRQFVQLTRHIARQHPDYVPR